MTESRAVSALLYSVNGTGLGHLTRLMAIGRWLRTLLNGLDLESRLFFLSCSDADFLLAQNGFPSFKLPSRAALRSAGIASRPSIDMLRAYALSAFERIEPNILIVDTFPTGTYDELLPILGRDDVFKVFIFREQRSDYVSKVPYEKLLANFDLVLIPHPPQSFELGFTPPPDLEIAWAGNIIFGEHNELWTKGRVRRMFGIKKGWTSVYTTAGGGGDRESQRTFRTLVDTVSSLPKTHLVVGAGPLNRQTPLRGENLTWTNHYPISRLFKGFDYAVSSSGYNSVHEMLHFGLPAIFYAQERGADDQLARALSVAEAGAGLALEKLTPETLRPALERMTDPVLRTELSTKAREMVPTNGARRAAEEILDRALPKILPGPAFVHPQLITEPA